MIEIDELVTEYTTASFDFTFLDELPQQSTPKTFQWSLTDSESVVINDRFEVAEAVAQTITVTLRDQDLPRTADRRLMLIVDITYDSDEGLDLVNREQVIIKTKDIQEAIDPNA